MAKQLRNSNQLSSLLDGDGQGLINLELQQGNIIKEQQKDIAINAMTDSKSTAKVLQVIAASTQTGGLNMYPYGVPTKPSKSQFFDIAQDYDNLDKLSNDIEMVSTQQSQQVAEIRLNLQISFKHI